MPGCGRLAKRVEAGSLLAGSGRHATRGGVRFKTRSEILQRLSDMEEFCTEERENLATA
jgi:hypothetical protein